VTRDRS